MQSEQICLEVQWHLFGSLCRELAPHSVMHCAKFLPSAVPWHVGHSWAACAGVVLHSVLKISPLKFAS